MSGRSSRQRGHHFERELASLFTELTGQDIRTGRYFGLHYGADLVTVTGYDGNGRPVTYRPDVAGWAIEAKADKSRRISSWLRQAHDQAAPGTRPVVVWKRKHHPTLDGSVFVRDEGAPRGWTEERFGSWLERQVLGGCGCGPLAIFLTDTEADR